MAGQDEAAALDDVLGWLHELNESADGPMYARTMEVIHGLRADVDRLRARTHEIQATEMAKRAALDSEVADWRSRWDEAKRWTEEAGLEADWSSVRPLPHYWGMTSLAARLALFRLVGERNEARAELDAARTREQAVRDLAERIRRDGAVVDVAAEIDAALGSATPQEGDNR